MKSISKRKIEVGLFPIVILLGIACGLMFCSFLLGFSAGNKVGFNEAREDSLKRMAKLPVGEVIQNDITKSEKSEVYTKLQKKSEKLDSNPEGSNPEGSNPEGSNLEGSNPGSKSKSLLLNDLLANKKEDLPAQEDDDSNGEVETIGSLIKKNKEKKEDIKEKEIQVVNNRDIPKFEKKIEVKKQKEVKKKELGVSRKNYIVKVIPKGWYAQVAAPTKIEEANALAEKLHSSGFRLVVEKALINDNTYFRVLVGSEENRTQALRLVDQLVREPYIKTTPFVRKIS